jgi:hypothetical protein
MKASHGRIVVSMLALLAGNAAHAQSRWTANGQFAVAIGDQTNGSLAFRGGIYRWLRDAQALGIEAGVFSWDGQDKSRRYLDERGDFASGYGGSQDTPMLQFIGGSMRVRGLREAANAAPYFAFAIGAYRQSVVATLYGDTEARAGVVRPGGSVTFGGGGTRGLKPCMEFRYDWVDTKPGPSNYFSAAMGLQLDR